MSAVARVRYTDPVTDEPETEETQFPAPGKPGEGPDGALERLPAPSGQAQEVMVRHLLETHELQPFNLKRHVHLGGPRKRAQLLTWNPANSSFQCDRCPGLVFSTGELSEETIHRAQRLDPGLQPHLAGLGDQADRDEMTRRYLDGHLNQERLRQLRGLAARRRGSADKRPAVAARRRAVQRWMLRRYVELGSVARVTTAAEELQRTDPDSWHGISDRPLAGDTLRKYWQDIDQQIKDLARQAFERRRQAAKKLPRPNT